jgi:hypothetical protein
MVPSVVGSLAVKETTLVPDFICHAFCLRKPLLQGIFRTRHIEPENRISAGTLAFASVYLSIMDIPGVKPLARECFLHRLFASITSLGTPTF